MNKIIAAFIIFSFIALSFGGASDYEMQRHIELAKHDMRVKGIEGQHKEFSFYKWVGQNYTTR